MVQAVSLYASSKLSADEDLAGFLAGAGVHVEILEEHLRSTGWKARARVTPRAKAALTPDNFSA